MKIVTTAVSAAYAGIWTAIDAGYFADEGLEVQILNVTDTSRGVPTLLSGEGQFSTLDGQGLVQANLTGADLRSFAAVTNRFAFSIMTQPDITTPEQLKGKKLGISGFGSSNDTAARQALAAWNLQPQTDVTFLPLNSMPNVLAGLAAKQVDAGVISPPTNTLARQQGFHELINLGKDGPEWPSVTLGTTHRYIQENPATVLSVLRGYSRGIHRFKTDKAYGMEVIQKYLQLNDQSVADDTWQQFNDVFTEPPALTTAGFQKVIQVVAQDHPEIANNSLDQYVDNSFIKQLEDSGFYRQLSAS